MKLNVRQTAALLNVSTKTIYRWLADGRLPGYRVNHSYRFDRAEILEWANAQRLEVTPWDAVPAGVPEPVPTFPEALSTGGIHYRVEGGSRDEALEHAVRMVPTVAEPERPLVFQAMRAREELASTAVGDGLAIPHLRNPLRFHLDRPAVSLCFLVEPVPWGSLDGKPVHVLFLVTASTVRAVLQLHLHTAFALRDPVFRALVLGQGPRQGLHGEAARLGDRFRAVASGELADGTTP